MDYLYENLGPERFQHFCQALLVREFPLLQCFPIGQPDGGRDAVAPLRATPGARGFMMFQVKFVRNPSSIPDAHKWLVDVLRSELPKLDKQIEKGASSYVLLTNVRGTAHPETGSIDQLDSILAKVSVPAVCWWRDDLNRRLDDAWDLKWSYPDLMTGPDLIRYVIQSGLSEDNERRANAVRSFLADQHTKDQEVRFKQAELENKLLDLFVDVPVAPIEDASSPTVSQSRVLTVFEYVNLTAHGAADVDDGGELPSWFERAPDGRAFILWRRREKELTLGAASMLLSAFFQENVPLVVIEGAPGQGKSTIVQYVCQVHRMRLLEESAAMQLVPESHLSGPIRLPFKVDLRDFAIWLARKNPFGPDVAEVPLDWNASLESFLAALIRHNSGGSPFNVADLQAVAKLSSILVVLDGLDEIAEISKRQMVVQQIMQGVTRLQATAASLQVVVTSRPAAFAASPGFPHATFPYFSLHAMTRELIDEYAEKWFNAKKLEGRERQEVSDVLREKLDLPHLRDLARNPMQLAIVLNLVHSRGVSVPDKRTSLYDIYIEIFFNREAEKSATVRAHRDLLINIHGYLAWVMHNEAELGHDQGTIGEQRLLSLVTDYLTQQGHDPILADTLFAGMVERVVAIVSRVEGTFEFEVQPLREYFAARYLYDTAPYSPAGAEKRGTKPDRFDAISRDFYWLNVTRFYAGCYSTGELASLVDSLRELAGEEGFRLIRYPTVLAATLLSDWVFAQQPRSMREVIQLILEEPRLRYLVDYEARSGGRNGGFSIPSECGRDEVVEHCFQLLDEEPPEDYAIDLIGSILANLSTQEVDSEWWSRVSELQGEARTRWVRHGLGLGSLSRLSPRQLEQMMADSPTDRQRLDALTAAHRFDYFEAARGRQERLIDAILAGDVRITVGHRDAVSSVLQRFGHAVNTKTYKAPRRFASRFRGRLSLAEAERYSGLAAVERPSGRILPAQKTPLFTKCLDTVSVAQKESKRSMAEWATSLAPWDNIVEKWRAIWGERWAFLEIANLGGGIKSRTQIGEGCSIINDARQPLCRRARYARLRAGSASWWEKQFDLAASAMDAMFIIMVLITWGSASTVTRLAGRIDAVLLELDAEDCSRLYYSTLRSVDYVKEVSTSYAAPDADSLPLSLCPRTVALLSTRAGATGRIQLHQRYLSDYDGDDPIVLRFCAAAAFAALERGATDWRSALATIELCHAKGADFSLQSHFSMEAAIQRGAISLEMAQAIAETPNRYPDFLFSAAETVCKQAVSQQVTPVGEIARRDKWFET